VEGTVRTLTIAVDVDEVCADLLGEWLRRYNLKYDDSLTPDDAVHWDLTRVVKLECGEDIYSFLRDGDLYENVLPIAGARDAIYSLLSRGHRVVYASACKGFYSAQAKQRWLRRWGFLSDANLERDFLAVTDKSLVHADILFDDRIDNVRAFQSFSRCGVLINRKHNERDKWPCRIPGLAHAPLFVENYLESLSY
jgi:5'-nucleotidase